MDYIYRFRAALLIAARASGDTSLDGQRRNAVKGIVSWHDSPSVNRHPSRIGDVPPGLGSRECAVKGGRARPP